ncbi:MAG: hypothetical protein V4594_22170 [Bacteroidota bacterium]
MRFSVTLFNFLSNPKLGHYGKHFNEKVSVVVFGGNDGEEMFADKIKSQDYVNLEILIQKPGEEMGDVVARSTGKYLLFLKGDVTIYPGLINNLIYRMKVYHLDQISLVPNRIMNKAVDFLVDPLKDFVLFNVFPLRLVRLVDMPFWFVNQQPCVFADSDRYKTIQDAEYEGKIKMELLQGNKFVNQQGQAGLKETGASVLGILGGNLFTGLVYLSLVIIGPIVMAINFEPVFLALPVGLIFLTRVMIAFLTGQHPVKTILFHPLQMGMLVVILIKGMLQALPKTVGDKN